MKFLEIRDAKGAVLPISKIILGGVSFGTAVGRGQSFEMMDRFYESGGSAIDTARVYCDWMEGGSGASERTIGEWIKARGIRGKITLITKGGHPAMLSPAPRLSRKEILSDMDESLRTLQTDYADLYLLHRDDQNRPVEEIMETLDLLVRQGKTRAVGVSNWTAERIRKAKDYAQRNGLTHLSVSEIQWSLAECFPETYNDGSLVCMTQTEYKEYLELGIPVLAFSSQASGVFSKAGDGGLESVGEKLRKFVTPENIRRYRNLEEFCKKTGLGKTAVSLGYLTQNRLPAAAIIGCRNMEQLEDSLTAADINLRPEDADGLIA